MNSDELDQKITSKLNMARRYTFIPEELQDPIELRGSKFKPYRVSTFEKEHAMSLSDMSIFFTYQPQRKPSIRKGKKTFCTKSTYTGEWEGGGLGFNGTGVYTFPHGVVYDGCFRNGEFSGRGALIYPDGTHFEGLWKHGRLVGEPNVLMPTGEAVGDLLYCKMPDRRFEIEMHTFLNPAGQEYISNRFPPRHLDPGCYDVGIGAYDPRTKTLAEYDVTGISNIIGVLARLFKVIFADEGFSPEDDDLRHSFVDRLRRYTVKDNEFTTLPFMTAERWIIENCRKNLDEPVGFCQDLYEHWTYGMRSDVELLDEILQMLQGSATVVRTQYSLANETESTEESAESARSGRTKKQTRYKEPTDRNTRGLKRKSTDVKTFPSRLNMLLTARRSTFVDEKSYTSTTDSSESGGSAVRATRRWSKVFGRNKSVPVFKSNVRLVTKKRRNTDTDESQRIIKSEEGMKLPKRSILKATRSKL